MVVFYFLKLQKAGLKPRDLIPRRHRVTRVVSLGSAPGINQLSMIIVQILLNNQLVKYGALSSYGAEIPLACAGVITKISMLFLGLTIGISQGCQPIWGFNYGAGKYARVKETFKKAAKICLLIGVAFFLFFQLFPARIIRMFGVESAEGVAFASSYFRVFMFMTFLNGLQPLCGGFFTSTGKALLGIVTSLARQVAFFIPLVLLLPLWFGIDGIMFAAPVSDAFGVAMAIFLVCKAFGNMKTEQ
jgi:Na+-driven multidrug efflux pump